MANINSNAFYSASYHDPHMTTLTCILLIPSPGVVPDDELGYMLRDRFGDKVHAFRKYQRMMYWMPKFKHANPYPVPYELPEDPVELARLALQRMAMDRQNKILNFEV